MPRHQPASQSDRVVLALREWLLQGHFPPGSRLTELGLVARLQASRTPVRHALARLAHEGLLEALPSGGFRVRAFTLDEIWDAIELRGILEGSAARLAAERLSDPRALASLKDLLVALDGTLPGDVDQFVAYLEHNERFHREIWRLSGSQILIQTIAQVIRLPFAAPGALVFSQAESAESRRIADIAQEQHRALVDAIERRAGARAEALAREHAMVAWRNLERALQDKTLFGRIPGASLVRLPATG
jgi:GntR family transcriptional regulator, vanillate catabolism transcriptional regulator